MGGEKTRPMWWQTLPTMLVLATIGSASDGAICPARCHCNDDTLTASCGSAALEVVPIQLNPEVRHIDLSDNKITHVSFTFRFYNFLVTLDLSSNKIKNLGSSNFDMQHNLKQLNLSRNDIEKISKDSFKGLRAVINLDLSHNKLEELKSESFRELHSLQVLKLSQNRLVYLEEGIFKSAKHLQELLLDYNLFLELPTGALTDSVNLRFLSLACNLIKSIKENQMPPLPELRTLLLQKNLINEIHQSSLSGLLSLDHLDLSDNNFTVIPTPSLMKLSNITKLKLSGNFISTVPPVAFKGLFHLRFLRLDRQEILQRIDARAFVDNINLERVWLDDNIAVDRLPTRLFHGNPHVTHLSVRNNRLTNIEVTHFPLDQLRVLKLGGNPLECNCSLSWLWHLIQDQKSKHLFDLGNDTSEEKEVETPGELVVDLEDIRCAGPEPLTDVLLADATESQVDCSVSWIAAVSATLTALFMVAIVGGLLYWGPIKRTCAKEKELAGVDSRCRNKTVGTCSNGRSEPFENIRTDKCMIAPPLIHHDYRSLPSWDPYNADCAGNMNIYEHLDLNNKTRPHIVYVMKLVVLLNALCIGLSLCFNGQLAELECPDDCDCHYFRINWVTDCSDSNLTEIPYDELSLNVYVLDLNNNQITDVGPFPHDIKMRRLQLADNLMTELKKESFAGLNYLIDADFSGNMITRVDPDCFDDSPGFITLELQGNPLDPVDGIFLSIKSLHYLDISNCGLKYLNPLFFANITALSTLDLSGNPLGVIDNKVFEPLSSLETLKMNACNLTYIANYAFNSLENLKNLELSANMLTTDWSSVLDYLPRLEYLDLRNSQIRHLPEIVFHNNTYLRTLILAQNELNDFDVSQTVGKLQQLDSLDLSFCNLTLPLSEDAFVNATKIRSLFLSGNSLFASDLLVALPPLSNLERLSLSNCGLTRLPDTFHNFKSLQELDISHNPLNDAFVKLLTPLDKLEYLNMGYSNLSYIAPTSFSKMTNMKRLVLSGNELNNLEAGLFGDLTKLESLELNSCGLRRSINATLFFNNLTYTDLTELQLAGNPLQVSKSGPLLPKQLSRLLTLDLSNCNLTFLPSDAFYWTRNITTLILSGNHFSSADNLQFLELLPKLKMLDLRYNKLSSFPPKTIYLNPNVEKLKLIGNPWRCDCTVAELWDWANLEKGSLGILEGSTIAAEHVTVGKTNKRKKLLVCNYDTSQPLPIITKTVRGRRPFIKPQRVLTSTNRTWAKYVRESGCEQLPVLQRSPRAANSWDYRGSELEPNTWAVAAINAAIVYITLMAIVGIAFLFTKRQTPRTAFDKNN
ncbi:slit homolog 1 protein-like [Tribolium madens]|uniref:slit homolog 1 protein-like n=1 Tax=Tribolium madens TaxID=41895 RepID=UPI001CF732A3|nr:slit homolog 1 protein-like [Tribolium madens]